MLIEKLIVGVAVGLGIQDYLLSNAWMQVAMVL